MNFGLQDEFSKKSFGAQVDQVMSWVKDIREGNLTSIPDLEAVLLRGDDHIHLFAIQMALPHLLDADMDRGISVVQTLLKSNNQEVSDVTRRLVFPLLSQSRIAEKLIENYQPKQTFPAVQPGMRTLTL